jgi:3-isopropylmalate/(R)-2-methylmalate dehydratase small subunit
MDKFTTHTGRAVPLRRSDVDTDQIIPSEWLKRIERTGFGAGLFSEWRENPEFVLNDPARDGATILIAGENFGCGSSREHAVWALQDYGFRAVIAPSFADIFRGNALKGGLLPIALPAEEVERLMAGAEADPAAEFTVDLERQEVRCASTAVPFTVGEHDRWRLLNGLDDIGLTLTHADEIGAYEVHRPSFTPSVA